MLDFEVIPDSLLGYVDLVDLTDFVDLIDFADFVDRMDFTDFIDFIDFYDLADFRDFPDKIDYCPIDFPDLLDITDLTDLVGDRIDLFDKTEILVVGLFRLVLLVEDFFDLVKPFDDILLKDFFFFS